MPTSGSIEILALTGLPEIHPGHDLAGLVLDACARQSVGIRDDDVLVLTQKAVSKAEGRIVDLDRVEPSLLARRFAESARKDPRLVELALSQARRIVRMDRGILISETHHGLVCANSGVDTSNLEGPGRACLLPEDPDRSAREVRAALRERTGLGPAVLVSDTFGRPWREGVVNVAIGAAGMKVLVDYRGRRDAAGRELTTTVIAVADEIAAAAELVMGKLDRVPAALVRGYAYTHDDEDEEGARAMHRAPERDLFR